ncbi:MAG: FecR domain-containing protein [Verrucomicrobiales bacterium]|nr:FecR domain-containing protein [Verrucomicrobiales bacterium]
MMPSGEHKDLSELLSRLVEETITSDEVQRLEQLLDGDSEAQKFYLNYMSLHCNLQESNRINSVASKNHEFKFYGLSRVAAVLIIILTGLFFIVQNDKKEQNKVATTALAEVVAFDGLIEWKDSASGKDQKLDIGKKLGPGTLEGLSAKSWVEIKYLDGSKLIISGVSELEMSDNDGAKILDLLRGDLSVDAKPQPKGKPMKVISPAARAEVLGTQFNVVAGTSSTRYFVNEGLVRVKRTHDGSVQEVPANHYVIAKQGQSDEFKSLPRDAHEEKWKAEFPRDARRGDLVNSTGISSINQAIKILSEYSPAAQRFLPPYSLRSKPCIWFEKGRKPELHFSVNIGVSATGERPVIINEEAVFRIKGSIDRTMFGVDDSNYFLMGLTSNYPSGGFAGKYLTKKNVDLSPENKKNKFEMEIPIKDFLKIEKGSQSDKLIRKSAAGLELFDVWFVTYQNVGLEIDNIEIIIKK